MPAFFDLLREESHPAARVLLGRFIFVYIHPYMDGNGRVGRFLMITMGTGKHRSWRRSATSSQTPSRRFA
jgi:fido (protein-threonine AMPylation protein)